MLKERFFFILFSILSLVKPLLAQNLNEDRLNFGISYFNVLRNNNNALESSIEYRSGLKFLELKPFAGITLTSAGGFYGMGGIYYDFLIGNRILFTPSFAAGYFERGHGYDLAYKIEFRSQIELSYLFQNNFRVGISINHISNANLGESNPGAESLTFHYSIPLQ